MSKNKEVKEEKNTLEDIDNVFEVEAIESRGSNHIEQTFIKNEEATRKIFDKIFDYVKIKGKDSQNNKKTLMESKGRIFRTKKMSIKGYDILVKKINGYGLNLEKLNSGATDKEVSAHISKELDYHNGALKQLGILVKVRNSSEGNERVIAYDIPLEKHIDKFY